MLTWAMHLTLLVPGLLWPREILRDTTFDLPLPALSRLLGRGRRWSLPGEEAWQADMFDLDEPLPAAALRLLGDGGWPGDATWLCLDPVHLRVAERMIIVDDPSRLALTRRGGRRLAPGAWRPCSSHWARWSRRGPATGTCAWTPRPRSRPAPCTWRPAAPPTRRCPAAPTARPGASCWPRHSPCCTPTRSIGHAKRMAVPPSIRSGPGAPAVCRPRRATLRDGVSTGYGPTNRSSRVWPFGPASVAKRHQPASPSHRAASWPDWTICRHRWPTSTP